MAKSDSLKPPLSVRALVGGGFVIEDTIGERLTPPLEGLGLPGRRRLEKMVDLANSAWGAGPGGGEPPPGDISPEEERAIRKFTRKDYARRLLDQYTGHALGGLLARADYDPCDIEMLASDAESCARTLVEQRGYEIPEEDKA